MVLYLRSILVIWTWTKSSWLDNETISRFEELSFTRLHLGDVEKNFKPASLMQSKSEGDQSILHCLKSQLSYDLFSI